MFLIGYGAKSRSMGGVGIGYTQDAIGNAMNPAGITSLKVDAMRLDMGAMLFYTPRSVTLPDSRSGPTAGDPITYDSGSNLFVIPSMGGLYKFNRKVTMGFSFVGSGGGSTRYTKLAPNGFNFFNPEGRTGVSDTLGVNLFQAQMAMSLAYKVNKKHTIAASPIIGIQTFRAYGLGLFKPLSGPGGGDLLSNNGNDWAYGAGVRFGWQGKLHKNLTVGATYASKIYMTEFDEYEGLFAEQGNFDSPANFGLGFAFNLTKDLVLAFDWQRVQYSDLPAVNNPIEALNTPEGFLGEDEGAGFGWEDQDIYKLGLKYRYNKEWDFMLGWNYGEAPMPKDQLLFSALAPAVTEHHLTLGSTYKPKNNMEWTLAYVHAFKNTEKGLAESGGQFDQFFPDGDPITGPGITELEMRQDSLELTFTYKM
jgi:long-chain fatty acid transport protein